MLLEEQNEKNELLERKFRKVDSELLEVSNSAIQILTQPTKAVRKMTVDAFDILMVLTVVAGSDVGNIGSVTIVVVLVMMVAFCGLPDTAGLVPGAKP